MDDFNPLLSADSTADDLLAVARRALQNVAESYHRTYDVFAELLQNAVDAVYQRYDLGDSDYQAQIWVDLDFGKQTITVCDNGIGITPEQFRRVLAPNVSFKDFRGESGSKRYRGHKGVGLAYLAYGFNYLRISTRTDPESTLTGEIVSGRRWVTGQSGSIPVVRAAEEAYEVFKAVDRGTAVTVQLDETTTPRSLPHIATYLPAWAGILRVQTAIGRVFRGDGADRAITGHLTIRPAGFPPETTEFETTYLFPHRCKSDEFKYLDLVDYFKRNPDSPQVSQKDRLRDGIFVFWNTEELLEKLGTDESVKEAKDIIRTRSGWAYGFMAYSADFWARAKPTVNDPRSRLIEPGVAIASDGMVIGDFREISLTRYIGRQQQISCLLHLDDLRPDLGRKSFEKEIEDTAQRVANRVASYFGERDRFKNFLRASPSRPTPTTKERDLQEWVFDSAGWARDYPLAWQASKLPLVSVPQQEQDVVSLFSQMVAYGLLPGYVMYSAGENNRQYDLVVRIELNEADCPLFGREHPQGLVDSAFRSGRIDTKLSVLEFKHSLSDLLTDLLDQEKRFKDIEIAVAWSAGFRFKSGIAGDYELRTVSTPDTVPARPFPGITHQMVRQGTEDQIWVVLLEDLFQLANDWEKGQAHQIANYPD